MDNPEYFHMSEGGSAFTPVRSSSPQYIGEYLHPRTLTRYEDDIDQIDNDEDDNTHHIDDDQHKYHSLSNSGKFLSLPSSFSADLKIFKTNNWGKLNVSFWKRTQQNCRLGIEKYNIEGSQKNLEKIPKNPQSSTIIKT